MDTFRTIPISRTHTPYRSLGENEEARRDQRERIPFLKDCFLLSVIMYKGSMHTYIQVLMKLEALDPLELDLLPTVRAGNQTLTLGRRSVGFNH